MSLRDLPPEQNVPPRRSLIGRLYYVPLVILMVCVLFITAVGFWARERNSALTSEAAARAGEPASLSTGDTVSALPESCAPAVDPPAQELWLEGRAAEAETVWQANTADLANSAYVEGEDGWVFWNDIQANNFSQAVGRRTLTTVEADQWHSYLSGMKTVLDAANIPFVIAVTPAKWGVYPEKLPAWTQAIRGSGPLDQMLARYPDLPIVDVRQPLREASVETPVFSKVNSHWTDYGAYLGWNAIAGCIDETLPQLGDFTPLPVDGVTVGADHNEYADYGITNDVPDWTQPDYADALRPVTITLADGSVTRTDGTSQTGLMTLPASTETEGAQSDSSALVLRDSFGDALSVPLQQSFARTWQVRHNFDAPDQRPDLAALIAEHHPDVVILQVAQRHLNFAPAIP